MEENYKESKNEDEMDTSNSWPVTVEIEESEPLVEVVPVHVDSAEHPSSESEEECSFQAVQEYESVLVDKMCEVCGNPFQAFELIHAKSDKKTHLTTCETCSYYITPHRIEIENHNHNNDINQYHCSECPKSFSRKDRLERHRLIHSELRPFACKFCEKSFKRSDKLNEHLKIAHGPNNVDVANLDLMCDVCGDVDGVITVSVGENVTEFVNLCETCNLSRQEKISDSKKNESNLFQCDLCSRYFSRKDHATRHRLSHMNVKPHECYICEKSFMRKDRLMRHMKTHPDAKPFSCKICFQTFKDRVDLKDHLSATHPNDHNKPHKCVLCQKAFRDKDKLRRHLTTHGNYKPYCCELCGKTFKLQESLLAHQRIHADWKPFKCETCGMAFTIKETFKRHLLVHSSVTKYTCHICSKTFKRSDKLKSHHLVHIDLRPFSCELCGSAFKRKDKYVRHRKQVHGLQKEEIIKQESDSETQIVCDICGIGFSCEDDLTEHKMVHYR